MRKLIICDEVIGQITSSEIQSHDGVGQGVSRVDGDCVGHTISGVEYDISGTTGSVQGQYGLDGDVHGGRVEGFEHDLCHLLSFGFGVEWGLGQEDGVFFWVHTEFIVKV